MKHRMFGPIFAVALVLAAIPLSASSSSTPAGADSFEVPLLPTVEGPITGPGEMFIEGRGLEQWATPSAAEMGYIFQEFFVSGTSAGRTYKVRMFVARPADLLEFSGHVLVEPKHELDTPFAWVFMREYMMSRGHVAIGLTTTAANNAVLRAFNPARYAALHVTPAQVSDVFAQVGYLLKSDQTPLPDIKALYFSGYSRTAGPAWYYMNTHHAQFRLPDGAPIYDAFYPLTTRTATRLGKFPDVDVPTILPLSELEVEVVYAQEGIDYRKPDSDEPGKQFRLYEVAGMAHYDSRYPVGWWLQPCDNMRNRYPYGRLVSTFFDHLIRWVEEGVSPPRADRISAIRGPGGVVEKDAHGNAVGGVRHTYVDVPIATYTPLNTGTDPNCTVYGSQFDFSKDKLASLYRNHGDYVNQVNRRLNTLTREGWLLEEYAQEFRVEAAQFDGIRRK